MRYLKGDYQLQEDEIDQIGYRLAKEMGHQEVYAVDWMEQGALQREISEVTEWAKEHQPELYEELFEPLYQLELTAAEKSVNDLLLYYNRPDVVEQLDRRSNAPRPGPVAPPMSAAAISTARMLRNRRTRSLRSSRLSSSSMRRNRPRCRTLRMIM